MMEMGNASTLIMLLLIVGEDCFRRACLDACKSSNTI